MSERKLTGKVIAISELTSGIAASTGNQWSKQEYTILEVEGNYPDSMTFEVFGADKIEQFAIKMGEVVTVYYHTNSKEYNGRHFNTVRAWKVERPAAEQPAQQTAQQPKTTKKSNDEIPF